LKHYAPRARLVLVDAPLGEIEARLADSAERWAGERVGVMLPAEIEAPAGVQVFAWGDGMRPRSWRGRFMRA